MAGPRLALDNGAQLGEEGGSLSPIDHAAGDYSPPAVRSAIGHQPTPTRDRSVTDRERGRCRAQVL